MGTFGGYPIAGQTEHFLVTYADEADLAGSTRNH